MREHGCGWVTGACKPAVSLLPPLFCPSVTALTSLPFASVLHPRCATCSRQHGIQKHPVQWRKGWEIFSNSLPPLTPRLSCTPGAPRVQLQRIQLQPAHLQRLRLQRPRQVLVGVAGFSGCPPVVPLA